MKPGKQTALIQVDVHLTVPVYKQIVQSICRNIENGTLARNDRLPSVNRIAAAFSLARGSVFTAYNHLRAAGIIDSIPGKGYYVASTQIKQEQRIFLLFSTFTAYKETLYNALLNSLPATSSLDIYFHHHNIRMFEKLISEQAGYYNRFVIMPEIQQHTPAILAQLDPRHTFLLDVGLKEYRKLFPGVYQHFEKDIYTVLMNSVSLISKYKRLLLLFPENVRTTDIITGFNRFSKKNIIQTEVRHAVSSAGIRKYDACIVIDDNHLVEIIKMANEKNWRMGKDIGIMSYNETNLKSVMGNGITTITTDFIAMGRTMAEMITTGRREVVENPFIMIDRKSF
jgi:DNA-binding transcriptional regulator YhcF (GntR family)